MSCRSVEFNVENKLQIWEQTELADEAGDRP